MKLIHRVGYYLGGFSIGLILLAFFLRGKNTSCDYGPNARTIKNISIKKKLYTENAYNEMKVLKLDSIAVNKLIQSGSVNFSESDTKSDGCKTYLIENNLNNKDIAIIVKNCDSIASILDIKLMN
jgi:hypothetical protein